MTAPTPPQDYDARIEEHERAHREATRDARRDFYRMVRDVVVTVAGGLALLGWAFHSTEPDIARAFWWAGHAFWVGGLTFSMMRAYRRAERRGEW